MDDKKIKKKKTHFFEIYIIKVLKQVSEISGITANAKQQLNSALCIIAKHISSIVLNLTIISKIKLTFGPLDINCNYLLYQRHNLIPCQYQ